MLYGYDTTEAICGELMEENRKLKAEMEIMLRPFELQVEVSKRIEQKIRAEAINEYREKVKQALIDKGIFPVIVKTVMEKVAEEMEAEL